MTRWTESGTPKKRGGSRETLEVNSNRQFEFQNSGEPFICVHNVTPSVAAMRVSNPDCSPLRINR